MSVDYRLGVSFLAGLLSFLSPCVLPLIPSYLSFLGGQTLKDLERDEQAHGRLVARTAFFILGFSSVFVALSLALTVSGILVSGLNWIVNLVAGLLVIGLGLHVIFDFASFLNYEKRLRPGRTPRGLFSSLLAGMAFGAGWSPCVGPILAGILVLAGQSGGLGAAALNLGAYSLGLGLPFMAASFFLGAFTRRLDRLKPWLPRIRLVCGLLLILIGLSIMTGRFQELNRLVFSGAYAFTDWSEQAPGPSRLMLSLTMLGLAGLPSLVRLARGKSLVRPFPLILLGLGLLAAILNYFQVISLASLLVSWLEFQGI
jgi:cytochrome c-type biogenesis protein